MPGSTLYASAEFKLNAHIDEERALVVYILHVHCLVGQKPQHRHREAAAPLSFILRCVYIFCIDVGEFTLTHRG